MVYVQYFAFQYFAVQTRLTFDRLKSLMKAGQGILGFLFLEANLSIARIGSLHASEKHIYSTGEFIEDKLRTIKIEET